MGDETSPRRKRKRDGSQQDQSVISRIRDEEDAALSLVSLSALQPSQSRFSNNDGITPHNININSHQTNARKRKRGVISLTTVPAKSRNDNNSRESFTPRELFAQTPAKPQAVLCEGIAQTMSEEDITAILGHALVERGKELIGGRDTNDTTNMSAIHWEDLELITINNKVCIRAPGCTNFAVDRHGKTFPLSQKPSQLIHFRCEECKTKYAGKNARKKISRQLERLRDTNDETATTENIKFICNNPQKARNEIERLREEVNRLKKVEAKFEKEMENRKERSNVKVLAEGVLAELDTQIKHEKDTRSNGVITQKEMWLRHTHHMLNVFLKGGNMREISFSDEEYDWAMTLLGRTSNRVYNEVSKVMKLPHRATIHRRCNELISSTSDKAYTLCVQTLSEMGRKAEAEKWSDAERLTFIALDSANVVDTVTWDHTTQTMVGTCEQHHSEQLTNLFHSIAESQRDNADGSANADRSAEYSGSIIDNIKTAKEHCVAKLSSIASNTNRSAVVATANCDQFTGDVVSQMFNLLEQTVPNYGIYPVGVTFDAASQNWSAVRALATHSVGEFIPPQLKSEYPSIDFEVHLQIMKNVNDDPILFLSDAMHAIKNLHTALEKSSTKNAKRNLIYGVCPMSLKMVEIVWLATGGKSNQLQVTKLDATVFNRDGKSRMCCTITCRLFSNSVKRMIKAAVEDPGLKLGTFNNKNVFKPLMFFIQHINDLIDITNGRYQHYTPENGESMQRKLLAILDWFSKWKKDNDKRIERKERTEDNFLAPITWTCLQNLILGHVFVIQYYCIEKKMSINPRSLSTDVVEHHFGNCRQMAGGSTQGLTAQGWNNADKKAGMATSGGFSNVGNCENSAPSTLERQRSFDLSRINKFI